MFDFLDNDYFVMAMEVFFVYFIITDTKKYLFTRKKEYLVGAILSFLFFIYALIPFYNKYATWDEVQKIKFKENCTKKFYDKNSTKEKLLKLCECYSDKIFKEYNYQKFNLLNIQMEKELIEFEKEAIDECRKK